MCSKDYRPPKSSLEKLPAKIRIQIYKYVLGGDCETTRYTLVPPALGSVNRWIRREVLFGFYAASTFYVRIPFGEGTAERFVRWCESAAMRENLARVGEAMFTHTTTMRDGGRVWAVTLGFDMFGGSRRDLTGHRLLICHDHYGWGALVEDFHLALARNTTIPSRVVRQFPVDRLVRVLCALAPLCTTANKQILLVEDCEEQMP